MADQPPEVVSGKQLFGIYTGYWRLTRRHFGDASQYADDVETAWGMLNIAASHNPGTNELSRNAASEVAGWNGLAKVINASFAEAIRAPDERDIARLLLQVQPALRGTFERALRAAEMPEDMIAQQMAAFDADYAQATAVTKQERQHG